MGKSSINGPFSIAMLNNQRVVYIYIYIVQYFNISLKKKGSPVPWLRWTHGDGGGAPDFVRCLMIIYVTRTRHKLVRYITTTKARIMELKHVKTNLVFRKSLKSHEITIFFTFFLLVNSQLSSATSNAFAKARYSALSPTGDAESVAQSPAMKLRKPTRNRTFRR